MPSDTTYGITDAKHAKTQKGSVDGIPMAPNYVSFYAKKFSSRCSVLKASKALKSRARAAEHRGDWQEAEILYRQLFTTLEYLFGDSHLDLAMASHSLADILERQAKTEEALKWRELTSEILLRLDGRVQ
jgi:hypothetical protein